MPVLRASVRVLRCGRAARRWPVSLAAVALVLLASGCQPVDPGSGADRTAAPEENGTVTPSAPGAPDTTTRPEDIPALLDEQASTAAQWQANPVPVEVIATLADGAWVATTVLYLAPDADRFLLIAEGAGGTSQQRPTLATLGLEAVPGPSLAEVAPLPELTQPPVELAEAVADVLAACDASGPVTSVVYTTGAPATWDGERWTEPPVWTATVSVADGAGAVVDPVTADAAADPCVAPAG